MIVKNEETQDLEQAELPEIYMHVFTNIKNVPSLLKLIRTMSPLVPNACYLDATRIYSLTQLQWAISKALLCQLSGRMKCKTILSEIFLSLSPDTAILDSFKHFGLSSTSHSAVVLTLDVCPTKELQAAIDGDLMRDFCSFDAIRDSEAIKKIYRLKDASEPLIISAMAMQGNI